MKTITLLLFFTSLTCLSQSQLSPGTRSGEARKSVKEGYTTEKGWELNEDDTLQLGVGSRDRQFFSYIYSSPASFSQIMDETTNITYLDNDYSNQIAIIKKFGVKGNKRIGYKAYAVVGIGAMENYWVEIEDAIKYGEILPPNPDFAPEKEVMEVKVVGQQIDKYDQLAKIKKLLDEGILTQEEYDTEKDKILNK